ncbi:MAG TPA: hypothetical protein VMF61_12580 [Candidatus Acidoferrales bacterium]|nr:hypothetical protein [Candidatus Acidoferrales bacterium]
MSAPFFIRAAAASALLLAASSLPGAAQSAIAGKMVVKAANDFVAKIDAENCQQFAATMSQMKSGGGSTSSATAKLKSNPGLRTQFVDIVAAPLLNKMIDCNMTP